MSDEELIRDQIHEEKQAAIKTIAEQYALLARCRDVLTEFGQITDQSRVGWLLNDIDDSLKRPWKQPVSNEKLDAMAYELIEALSPEGYEPEDLQTVREVVARVLRL